MSVYADGLMRKAKKEMKKNFDETGVYETNVERTERESKQKPVRDLYENRPLEWALRKTYLEYLSENNLNEIIPFGIVEKLKIFSSVGRQYELPATFTNTKKPKRKLKKELSDYETTVYKNMHKFCKEFIKLFVAKYKELPEDDKNDIEGYKKALLSDEEFISICVEIENQQL